MVNTTVLAFDLSTNCIGIVAGIIDETTKKPLLVKSCPVSPPHFSPTELGYMTSKKKLPTKLGESINTYYLRGETSITKQEKKRRDVEVRTASNAYVLDYIGKQLGIIITTIKPDLIIVEKNEIFNGVLTSVLLGKVMGVLIGVASSNGIKCKEFKVKKVRTLFDITRETKRYTGTLSESDIKKIPDMTKRVLRNLMEEKYGIYGLKCHTDDEGDAGVVFNYWYEEDYLK